MLIEVAGIDGAGKSTVIAALRSRLRHRQVHVYERPMRSEARNLLALLELEHGTRYTVRDRILAMLLDNVRQAHSELSMYRGSTFAHVFVTGYSLAIHARLLREGLHGDEGLAVLANQLPVADASVFLPVSPETALSRIRSRPQGDSVLEDPDPLSTLRASAQAFQEAFSTRRGMNAYAISSESASQSVDEHVATVLSPLLPVRHG